MNRPDDLAECCRNAEETGILSLYELNLRTMPDVSQYELSDLIELDLSCNKFQEVPADICVFTELESLNMFRNLVQSVPDLSPLTSLSVVNLSRNQLTSIPRVLCTLPLKVLNLNTNRLTCLPPDIGELDHLTELDLSNNELISLPGELGDLDRLQELNVMRNKLQTLPRELGKLQLNTLNLADNQITELPLTLRHMKTLDILQLDNNPLLKPPANLCVRGRVWVFKYLTDEAKRQHNERFNPYHDGSGLDLTFQTPHQASVRRNPKKRTTRIFERFVDNVIDLSPEAQMNEFLQDFPSERPEEEESPGQGPIFTPVSSSEQLVSRSWTEEGAGDRSDMTSSPTGESLTNEFEEKGSAPGHTLTAPEFRIPDIPCSPLRVQEDRIRQQIALLLKEEQRLRHETLQLQADYARVEQVRVEQEALALQRQQLEFDRAEAQQLRLEKERLHREAQIEAQRVGQERQAAEKLRLETELLQQEKAQLEADRLLLQAQQAETDHLRLERERLIQARQEEQHKVDVLRREREELELQALQSRQGREQEQEQLLEQQRAEHQRLQSEAAQLRIEQEQVELERFKLEEEHAKFERLQQEEEAMRSEYNRLSQSLQAESDRTAKERARLKREAEEVERERARLEQERLSNQQLRQELEQQEHPQPETESQLKTKQPDSSKTDEDARWEAFLARQRVKEAAVKKGITIRPPRQSTKIAATRPRRDSASPSPGQQGASTSQTQGAKEDMGRPSLIARPTSRERLRPASPHTSTPTATERAVRSSMTGSPLSVDCGVRATPSSYMLQLVDASTDASGAVDHTDTSAGTRVPVSSIPRLLQNSKGRLSPRGSFSLKAANATDLQTVQNLRKSRLAQQTAADVVRYAAATDARSKSVTALLKAIDRISQAEHDVAVHIAGDHVHAFLEHNGLRELDDEPSTNRLARILIAEAMTYEEAIQAIENYLQVLLPDNVLCGHDLPKCLSNGVILCQVVQKAHPEAVPNIGTVLNKQGEVSNLKARKNVECFLAACQKVALAVPSAMDILQQRDTPKLISAIRQIIKGVAI